MIGGGGRRCKCAARPRRRVAGFRPRGQGGIIPAPARSAGPKGVTNMTGTHRGRLHVGRGAPAAPVCLLVLLLPSPGCTTQDSASLVAPCCGERFQECTIRMDEYECVQRRGGGQDPNLAVAVAISGGGHRAGNFAAGVLLGLEAMRRPGRGNANALREVDYLSTVSGGGLAAAAYIASLHDYIAAGGSAEGYSLAAALGEGGGRAPTGPPQAADPLLRGHLQYNYVNDIIRGALTVATLGSWHRGDFLENSFDDHVLGGQWRRRSGAADASLRLRDVFVPRGSGRAVRLPYWGANATTYENAAIFPFAPDHLKLHKVCGYTHRLVKVRDRDGDPNRFAYDAPLALGLAASGTFPVAIPAISLDSSMDPNNPYLHLLDGGLADMFGVMTAVRMLRQDPAGRKVLIVVDAYKGPLTPFSNCEHSPAMLTTAARVATGFLDAWRTRHREVIRALCAADGAAPIEPAFLSFDDLLDCKDCRALEPFGFSAEDARRLALGGLGPGLKPTPFNLARDVWTWYGLSGTEQKLLLAVGRFVVNRKADQIRKAMSWARAGEGQGQ